MCERKFKYLFVSFSGRGGFCWMENGTTLLFAVGVPIAFFIFSNFVALTWTAFAIYKVRKVNCFIKQIDSVHFW